MWRGTILTTDRFNEPRITINRVYTKLGDSGETKLVGGQKVSKGSLRLESYGTVDELNAGSVPGLDLLSKVTLKNMYIPEKSKETVIIDGAPDEIAVKLMDIFKNEIKITG